MEESKRIAWRQAMEKACELKEAIDHATRWKSEAPENEWWYPVLIEHGIDPIKLNRRSGDKAHPLSMPNYFAVAVFGGWACVYQYSQPPLPPSIVKEIPPWAVFGWVRKAQYRETPSLDLEALRFLAKDLQTTGPGEVVDLGITDGFEGLDFYLAGEGKNRTQLQRLAGVDRKTNLRLYPMPDLSGATVRPLVFAPSMAVLSLKGEFCILPFGNLSMKLLECLGVKVCRRPALFALARVESMPGHLGKIQALSLLIRGGADRLRLEMLCSN